MQATQPKQRAHLCQALDELLLLLNQPGMLPHEHLDGLDRFERLQERFSHQRAIVVSGYAPPERAEAALEK